MTTCLACHGSADYIAPSTRALLHSLYPRDRAVNFTEGDLRGAIVVTFSPQSPPTPLIRPSLMTSGNGPGTSCNRPVMSCNFAFINELRKISLSSSLTL